MLQIHVVFSGDNILETKDCFVNELNRILDSEFYCFESDETYLMSSTRSDVFIRFDLSASYSMKFASCIVKICDGLEHSFVDSILYTV